MYKLIELLPPVRRRYYRRLFILMSWIRGARIAVDIGCGVGLSAEIVAERVGLLYMVDKDPEALKLASARASKMRNVELILSRAEDLPLPDSIADLVYFHDSFDEIQEKERAISEALRVLKPEGVLAIMDWDGSNPLARLKQAILRVLGFDIEMWPLERLLEVLKSFGTELILFRSWVDGSFILLARKEPRRST